MVILVPFFWTCSTVIMCYFIFFGHLPWHYWVFGYILEFYLGFLDLYHGNTMFLWMFNNNIIIFTFTIVLIGFLTHNRFYFSFWTCIMVILWF